MSEFLVYSCVIGLLIIVLALRVYLSIRNPIYHNDDEGWFDEDNNRDTQYPKD